NITQMTNLTELHLRWNTILDLPESTALARLTGLKVLDLAGSHLKELPSLLALTNLTSLDLSFNEFEGLPSPFPSCFATRTSPYTLVSPNTEQPDFLRAMTWLQQLALYHNCYGKDQTGDRESLRSIYTPTLPCVNQVWQCDDFKHVDACVVQAASMSWYP